MLRICVLGAGNGALATAADLSLKGHEVRLFNRTPSRLIGYAHDGGININGVLGRRLVRIHRFEVDLRRAVENADAIIVAVPATGHEYYAGALAPVAEPGQVIILEPGHTGGALHFVQILRSLGSCAGPVAETNTLAYICRIQTDGSVGIFGSSKGLMAAAMPSTANPQLDRLLHDVFPSMIVPNVLHTSLANLNAVMHPPGMVLGAWLIQKTGGDFCYYNDSTEAVADTIEKIDEERVAIMRALGVPGEPFLDHFFRLGYTTAAAFEARSVLQALNESEPNRTIKAPASLDHRYLHEDIGYGLVPMSALGSVAGVRTPVMDALTTLASVINRVDYRREGLSLSKLGLDGLTADDVWSLVDGGKQTGAPSVSAVN